MTGTSFKQPPEKRKTCIQWGRVTGTSYRQPPREMKRPQLMGQADRPPSEDTGLFTPASEQLEKP